MKYPVDCDSPRRKTEYLYKAQEELRLLHNIFSKWLHEGLGRDQYNELPKVIITRYPYETKLSQEAWVRFQKEDFTLRSDKICQEICVQRAEFKNSSWPLDIGEI